MNPFTINLINRLLSQFSLVWENEVLYYVHQLQHDVVKVEVSPDPDDVLNLLGLPSDIGYNIIYDSHLIASSRYFNWKVLKKNKDEIRPFLAFLKDYNYKTSTYTRNGINVVKTLKKHLNLDITSLINSVVPEDYDFKEIRNKYNGKLVKRWIKENECNEVFWVVDKGFKSYIMKYNESNFDYYLYNTSAKHIRIDFIDFILFRKAFPEQLENLDLPF